MFKALTDDPRILRDSIETISQIIDDGLFKLGKDGIELLAADRALVSVVDFKLKPSAFKEYVCDESKEIGINLLNFLTFLKRAAPNDKMTLELNEKESKLEMFLKGESNRKFAIPLIEVSKRDIPQVSQLDFVAGAEVKSNILEEGINDADIISDSVIFELSPDELKMFAKGNSSKTELVLEKGNEALIDLKAKEKVDSRYSLEYLKKMVKGSRLSDEAKLWIGKDFPMKLQFLGENASLTFILAPRVSEE